MQKNIPVSPSGKIQELKVTETKDVAGGAKRKLPRRHPIIWVSTFPARRG